MYTSTIGSGATINFNPKPWHAGSSSTFTYNVIFSKTDNLAVNGLVALSVPISVASVSMTSPSDQSFVYFTGQEPSEIIVPPTGNYVCVKCPSYPISY